MNFSWFWVLRKYMYCCDLHYEMKFTFFFLHYGTYLSCKCRHDWPIVRHSKPDNSNLTFTFIILYLLTPLPHAAANVTIYFIFQVIDSNILKLSNYFASPFLFSQKSDCLSSQRIVGSETVKKSKLFKAAKFEP